MKQNLIRQISMLIFAICLCLSIKDKCLANAHVQSKGTKDNPYTISTVQDLLDFAYSVNNGKTYAGEFILQTNDINLEGVEWKTIGPFDSEYSFMGTYDGDGHVIENLSVTEGGNNAFFGKLGGTVMNLGIASGYIEGTCVGSITSHSSNSNATIINCYNRATVEGARAGGIADNFNGTITNCLSECELIGDSTGGIVSYDAQTIVNDISIGSYNQAAFHHDGIIEYTDKNVNYAAIAEKMNQNIYYSAYISGIDYRDVNLWKVSDEKNRIIFSPNKASFEFKYISTYIRVSLIKYFPYLLLISSACLITILITKVTSTKI